MLPVTERGPVPGSGEELVPGTSDPDGERAEPAHGGMTVEGPKGYPWGRQVTLTSPGGDSFVLIARAPEGT